MERIVKAYCGVKVGCLSRDIRAIERCTEEVGPLFVHFRWLEYETADREDQILQDALVALQEIVDLKAKVLPLPKTEPDSKLTLQSKYKI